MNFLADWLAHTPQKTAIPPGFTPLPQLPLVILVGLTGVGKSTVTDLLRLEVDFWLLPNRRQVTDDIIIASLQRADGIAPQPVTDRLQRFEYTARYRRLHPGGMAFALGQLAARVHPDIPLIFDGLRGLDETKHAVECLPLARFVVLDAPDVVRLTRLLQRGDTFDQVALATQPASQSIIEALTGVEHVESVFSADDVRHVARFGKANGWTAEDVAKKAAVIVKERRNYDSTAARAYLTTDLPPHRVLVADTAQFSAAEIAAQVKDWLLAPADS